MSLNFILTILPSSELWWATVFLEAILSNLTTESGYSQTSNSFKHKLQAHQINNCFFLSHPALTCAFFCWWTPAGPAGGNDVWFPARSPQGNHVCETGTPSPALELQTPKPAHLEKLPGNEEALDKRQDCHTVHKDPDPLFNPIKPDIWFFFLFVPVYSKIFFYMQAWYFCCIICWKSGFWVCYIAPFNPFTIFP